MKKWFVGLVLLCFQLTITATFAQNPRSDSLRAILRTDTANFDLQIRLAKSFIDINNAQAMVWARKARENALHAHDTVRIVHASRVIGQIANRLGNMAMAIEELLPLLTIAESKKYNQELKMILNSLATAFTYTAQYDKALECHFKSLVLREMENNKKDISVTFNNIAAVYMLTSNNEQALIYLKKCQALKEEIGDRFDLHRLYGNLASCYSDVGDYQRADAFFDKAIKECEPTCANDFLMFTEYCKGESYRYRRQFSKGKSAFMKSLALAEADSHSQYRFLCLNGLAQIALDQEDLRSLGTYLSRIDKLPGREPFLMQLQLFYSMSSEYYSRKGNFEKAFTAQKKYSEIRDSINNTVVNKKITNVELKFVERENLQKIREQENAISNQKIIIQKQKIINALVGGVAILTIVLILVLFKMNRRKSQINKTLDLLVKERTLELEKNQIALSHSFNEQTIILEKVRRELNSSLATIRGINQVASMENLANVDQYLKAVEATLFRSIEVVRLNPSFEHSELR